MSDAQSREPGFESPLLPFQSLNVFPSFSMLQSSDQQCGEGGGRTGWSEAGRGTQATVQPLSRPRPNSARPMCKYITIKM